MKPLGLQNKNGRIACQFSVGKQRYSLYGLGNWDSHSDKQKAESLIRVVEADILEGRFDHTLEKYKQGLGNATKSLGTPTEMFAKWVESLDISEKNYRVHYEPILDTLIANQGKNFSGDNLTIHWEHLASRTYNDRVGYLRRFGKWLVDEGYLTLNPYRNLKNRKVTKKEIRPFTQSEVRLILWWLDEKNRMVSAYYEFLFLTGCRPSEALALRKVKVDMLDGTVTIDEALVRGDNYQTSAKHRIRKGTKTGDTRVLPLTEELSLCIMKAFGEQQDDCINSELVFCNSRGEALDDTNLNDRYWRKALTALNLPYRKPYTTRHTAASTILENGGTLADAAKLLGHADLRMVSTTYGHAVKDVQLPDYNLPDSN